MAKDESQAAADAVDPEAEPDAPVDPFQAALAAKKGRGAYGPGGTAGGNGPGRGSSAKAGGRREFRRKSG
jgi:hypothetical protein